MISNICECCFDESPLVGHTKLNGEPIYVCYPCQDNWCHLDICRRPPEKVNNITDSKIWKFLAFRFMWGCT